MKYDDSIEHYNFEGSVCVNCGIDHEGDTGPCACGAEGNWTYDPFDEAMNGNLSYSFLCENCEDERNASV